MDSRSVTRLNEYQSKFVKKHRIRLKDLPKPGKRFEIEDVQADQYLIKQCMQQGVIKRVDRSYTRGTWMRSVYQTTEDGYDAIQKWLEIDEQTDGFLPCGHDGFTNHGDSLECKRCGEIHDKSEVRQ